MKYTYILLTLIISSCNSKTNIVTPQLLNGHWEIEHVVTSTDKTIQYGINSTVDFYYLDKNNSGYLKKLKVSFSGDYKSNSLQNKILVASNNNNYYLKTITDMDTLQMNIISLTEQKLVLQNKEGALFYYNKHEPFNYK